VKRGPKRALLAVVLLALPLLLGAKRPEGLGDVREVRTWSYPDYTRVVVELTRPVRLADEPDNAIHRLAANRSAERPERLYLDFDGIWVGRRFEEGIPVDDGLLQAVRLGQFTLTRTRLVIDLERYERHRLLMLRHPDRIVVDVYSKRESPEKLRWPTKPSGDSPDPRLSMPLRSVQTVVIDAGHGGRDPGATGIGGVREKDVNLKLARLLGRELESRGFAVTYTRERDVYLDLEQRTAVAESAGGDLFVSLHANASPRRGTRGIEIYYLDENHNGHDADVAARENGVPRDQLDSLQRTLARFRVSEASAHSATLADLVHERVMAGLAKRYRDVPDLGVKTGPFYVLFLSSMPSILVETGFLTNKRDAKLLRDPGYLSTFAEQIAVGLATYRDRGMRLAARDRRP